MRLFQPSSSQPPSPDASGRRGSAFWTRWVQVSTCLLLLALTLPARAHNTPFSYIDLKLKEAGVTASVEAYAVDWAHELPDVDADLLMRPGGAEKQKQRLFDIAVSRFALSSANETLQPELRGITAFADKQRIRLSIYYPWREASAALHVHCQLFPYDTRHRTYLNVYQDSRLTQQTTFEGAVTDLDYKPGSHQTILAVVKQFLVQGVYHIFTGPDHILFIVGLLLLGGTIRQLLKIVTAFTIAHSITLCLATLNILNPPARVIEPMIALSIVFVGVHSMYTRWKHQRDHGIADGEAPALPDARLLFAFGFGFIHGFGFANALHEMELPPAALGWTLLSFNLGVEFGQACIVLTVAPLLAFLHRKSEMIAQRVVTVGSLTVIVAGAFWFVQRVLAG